MSARKSNSSRSEGLSHKAKYVSSSGTCRTIIHPAYARHSLYANQGNEESIYSGPCKTNSDQITRSFSTRTPLSTRLSVFVKRVDHTRHIAQVDMEKHRFVKRRLLPEVFNKLPESRVDPDGGESSCNNSARSTALSQCPETPQNRQEVPRKPKTVTRSSTPRPSYKSSPPPPPPSLGVRNDDVPCPAPIIKVVQSGSHSSARPDSKRFSQRKFLPSLPFKNIPVNRILRFLRPPLERRNSCPSLCISELCLEPDVDLTSHPHRTVPKAADESAANVSVVDNILIRHPVKWTSHSELQRPEAEGYIVGLSAGEEVACSTGSDSSAGDFYDSLGSNAVTPQPSPPPQFVTCSSSGEINNIQIPSSDYSERKVNEAEICTQINKQISPLEGREELNSSGDERRSVIGSESVRTKAGSDLVLISAEQRGKDEDGGCGESGIEADRSSCNDCSGSQCWDHHRRNVKDGQGFEEGRQVSLDSNTSSDYSSSCFNSSGIDVNAESSVEERRNSEDRSSQILTGSNSRVCVQLDRSDNSNQSISNNSSVCTQQESSESNQSGSSNNICAQQHNNSESCNQSASSNADDSGSIGSDCNANFQHLDTCPQSVHSNNTALTSESENNINYHLEDKKICFDVCREGANDFTDCALQLNNNTCDQTANKTDFTQHGNETNSHILLGNCSDSVKSNNESDLQLFENIIDSTNPKSQSDSLILGDNCDRVTPQFRSNSGINSGINSDSTLPDQNQDSFISVDTSSVDRNKKIDLVQSDSNGNSIQPDNQISCLIQFENSNQSVQNINSPCLQGDREDITDTDSTSKQKESRNGDNYNNNSSSSSSSSSQRTNCDNSDNNEADFRNDGICDSFQANNRNSPKSNLNNSCIDHQVNNSYTDLKGNNSDNSCTDIEVSKTSDNNRCTDIEVNKTSGKNRCIDIEVNKTSDNNSYTDLKGNNSDNRCTDIEVSKTSDNNRCIDIEVSKSSDNNRCIDIEVSKSSDNDRCIDIEVNKTSDNNRCIDIEVNKTSDNNRCIDIEVNKTSDNNRCIDIEVNKTSDNNRCIDIEVDKTSDNNRCIDIEVNKTSDNRCIDIEVNKTSDNNRCSDIEVNKTSDNNRCIDIEVNKTSDNNRCIDIEVNKTSDNNRCIDIEVNKTSDNRCIDIEVNKTSDNNRCSDIEVDKTSDNNRCTDIEVNKTSDNNRCTDIEVNKTSDNNRCIDIEVNKTSDSNRCTDIQVNNSDNNNSRTDNKGNNNSDINSKSSSHTGNNNSVCIGRSVETVANNPFQSVTQEDIVNNNSPILPNDSYLKGNSTAVTNIKCNGDSDLRFEASSCDTSDHNSSAAVRDNNNISYLEVGDYSSHYTNSKAECNNISLLQVDSGRQTVVSNQHNNNNDSSSDFVKSGDKSTNIQAQSNINTQSSNPKSIDNTLANYGSSCYHTDTIPHNSYNSDSLHHTKDNNITRVPLGNSPSQPITDSSNSTYNSNNNRSDKEQYFNNSRSYSQPSICEKRSSDNNSESLCHVSNFSENQEEYDPNNSLITISSASQNHYNSCIEIKNSGDVSRGTLISVNGNHSTGERRSYYPVNEANVRNTLIKVNDFTAGLGNRHDSLDFGERHSSSSTSELCSADINECYNVKLDAPQEVIVAGFHDFCHTMLSVEDSSLESQDSGKDSQRGCDAAYETTNGSLSEEVRSSCSSRYPRNDCIENNNCNGHCQTKPSYLLTSLSKLTQNCKDPLKKTGSHPSGRLESSSDNLLEEIQKSKLMEKKMNIADAEVIEAIRQLDRSLVDASVSSGDVSTNNFANHQSTTLEPKRQANVILEIKNHPKVSRDDKVQCDNLIEEVMLEDISKRIANSGPLPSPFSRGGIAVTISNAKTHHLQSPHNQAVTTFQRIPANHKQSAHMGMNAKAHAESKNLPQELNSVGQTSTNIRVEDCHYSSSPNSTCTFTSHYGSVCSFAPQADKSRSTSIPCTQQHEETKKMNAIPDGRGDAISLPVTFTQDGPSSPHPPTTPLQVSVDLAPAPHGVQDVVACHRTSPCSVDSGTSSHNQGYFVVVAIDFGTTYSGYAFSFTRDPDNVHMMKKWDGGDPGVFNQKTPTTLLLTPEGTFHSFGYSARDYYHDLDTEEAKRWMYFDKFKMALHHSEHLSLDTEIKSANGRAMPAISVFAHALRYFKDHALQELSEQSATRILNEDVRWVVTVPAIWKQPAKQFMRAAAYKAGIASSEFPDQLLIALEPEAASIYCRRMRLHQLVPDDSQMQRASFRWQEEEQETKCSTLADQGQSNMPSMPRHHPDNSFTTGTRYMVVDCGGGTVDITVHELLDTHGTLKELQKASGGPYGSIGVDMDFERLLCDIFGAEFISQFKLKRPTGFVDLMIAFEARKRNASPYKSNPLNISLPFSFIDYYKKYKGSSVESAIKKSCHKDVKWSSQGMLRLEQSAMESLFHRTVKQIREHIESIVTLPELNIDHLFLVGGFAESLILQKEIRDYFSPKIKVIIPHGVSLAILKGAVLFGLDPTIVNIRRLRMTYGVGVLNRFIHGVHPKEKLVIKDGIQWCADVFDKFVVTDQSVGLGDVVVRSYTPAKAGQSCSVIHIYCSEKDNVYFITDPGVKRCATLILDLSDSRYIQSREIQTRMMFGDTEIKVSALDVITGKCVKSEVDFLGH